MSWTVSADLTNEWAARRADSTPEEDTDQSLDSSRRAVQGARECHRTNLTDSNLIGVKRMKCQLIKLVLTDTENRDVASNMNPRLNMTYENDY